MTIAEIGPVDAVLLTHDRHADNLDDSGGAMLTTTPTTITTRSGAARLGGSTRGLAPGETSTLSDNDRPSITSQRRHAGTGPHCPDQSSATSSGSR